MAFLLPETARKIVGNGSLPTSGVHRLPIPQIIGLQTSIRTTTLPTSRGQCHIPNPFLCIATLFHKDVAIITSTIGVLYMTSVCIQASLSSIFIDLYHLGELESGLIYLPFGFGCALAAYFTGEIIAYDTSCVIKAFNYSLWPLGKILDKDYRHIADVYEIIIDTVHGDDILGFPIEKARLRSILYPIVIALVALLGYGWSLDRKAVCAFIILKEHCLLYNSIFRFLLFSNSSWEL